MKRAVAIGFLVAAFALAAVAQHGTAQAGDADPNYGNDTWTGTVSNVDPGTMMIELTSANGEKFTGTLHKPLQAVDANGQPMRGGSLGPGAKVTVYYVPKGQSFTGAAEAAAPSGAGQDKAGAPQAQGQKQTAQDNHIYKIKLLDSGAGAPQPPQQQPQAPPK